MDWLTELLAKIGMGAMDAGSWGSAIGQGAVMGAGTGGIGALLAGQDVGRGMVQGAALGGIGGAGAKGLGMLASPDVIAAQDASNTALMNKMNGVESANIETPIARPVQPAPVNLAPQPNIHGINNVEGAGITQINPKPISLNIPNVDATKIAPEPSFMNKVGNFAVNNPGMTSGIIGLGAGTMLNSAMADNNLPEKEQYSGPLSKFKWSGGTPNYDPLKYKPTFPYGYAAGGITDVDGYASNAQNVNQTPNILGQIDIPNQAEVADPEGYASNSMRLMAHGGVADLGGYRSGGSPNLLQGPGDGVSDDLKATIADRQPARLASGEYIVPSRIVSELGNGSTDAGAKRLDMMVQKVNAGRAKTLGGKKYAKDTKAYKHLPV